MPDMATWDRLFVLEGVSSLAMMDEDVPTCPLCGAEAQVFYLRAGFASFIAAIACSPCQCVFRATDAFSLADT